MNDRMPDLHRLHYKQIIMFLQECYPESSITMDGTPLFAEAECIIIRVVHRKTRKIHELVIGLELFAEGLDGASLTQYTVDTFIGKAAEPGDHGISKQMRHLIAVAIDRGSTNKRAKDILHEDHSITPFAAYSFPHGGANCGKKGNMVVGKPVLKHLSIVMKYPLCKARKMFSAAFGEREIKWEASVGVSNINIGWRNRPTALAWEGYVTNTCRMDCEVWFQVS